MMIIPGFLKNKNLFVGNTWEYHNKDVVLKGVNLKVIGKPNHKSHRKQL